MNKLTLKYILPPIIFILFLIPIILSSLLDLEKKRENEITTQRILAEQQAQKIAEEAKKKIT